MLIFAVYSGLSCAGFLSPATPQLPCHQRCAHHALKKKSTWIFVVAATRRWHLRQHFFVQAFNSEHTAGRGHSQHWNLEQDCCRQEKRFRYYLIWWYFLIKLRAQNITEKKYFNKRLFIEIAANWDPEPKHFAVSYCGLVQLLRTKLLNRYSELIVKHRFDCHHDTVATLDKIDVGYLFSFFVFFC